MYSSWQLAGKYFRYYLSASNGKGHGTHSPFVFNFITGILNDKQHYPAYQIVEELRKKMEGDKRIVQVEDMGAGSSLNPARERTVASLAKNAAKPAKYGQLLFRMVQQWQPNNIIELGTSLGITTAYLALANPGGNITTLEGATEVAGVANENFKALQLRNCSLVKGNFDDQLAAVLDKYPVVDFAFIDGNHSREPTMAYFHQLLAKTHNDTVMVFDDIHWSSEMEEAWRMIKAHPSVHCSVDLFFIGIVFFRQEFREKQHFTIRF